MISRWPSAGLLALGLLPMFLLGLKLGGRPAAYLAALLYALHPTLLINGRRAMMEGSLIAFSLFAVLFAVWLLETPTMRGRLSAAVGLGIASGLALASKHTAVFALASVYMGIGLWLLARYIWRNNAGTRYRDFNPRRDIEIVTLSLALAALTFLALNPAWWGDPVARVGEVLRLRSELLDGQTAAFGGYVDWGERLMGFTRQTFAAAPQYYEIAAWQDYIGDQIAHYEASGLAGIAGSPLLGAALFALLLVGLWALWRDRQRSAAARWIAVVWALIALASTALLTPIEWARYYLPAIPAVMLLAAIGATWAARQAQKGAGKLLGFPAP